MITEGGDKLLPLKKGGGREAYTGKRNAGEGRSSFLWQMERQKHGSRGAHFERQRQLSFSYNLCQHVEEISG